MPFAQSGCEVTGIDISETRIEQARLFFEQAGLRGEFVNADFLQLKELNRKYDVIIVHDVFEHIVNKELFLALLPRYLEEHGCIFIAFPAWQMPFGGHQQICRSFIVSHLPFIHLLPSCLYKSLLHVFGESSGCIQELASIKETRVSIESFERLIKNSKLNIDNRQLWFINPHYRVKFGIPAYKLNGIISKIKYLRDFVSSACFYILTVDGHQVTGKPKP